MAEDTPAETLEMLQAMLSALGLQTEVITQAKSGSCYLRFADERMGKVRIGDHDERECYGYRWQIRTDIDEDFVDDSKGHKQFFYSASNLGAAVAHMLAYSEKINPSL